MKEAVLLAETDAATDITTVIYDLVDLNKFSLHVILTGVNLVGSFYIEGANTITNLVPVLTSVTPVTASDEILMPVSNAEYRYMRAVWDYTSGTGTIKVLLVAKENFVRGF